MINSSDFMEYNNKVHSFDRHEKWVCVLGKLLNGKPKGRHLFKVKNYDPFYGWLDTNYAFMFLAYNKDDAINACDPWGIKDNYVVHDEELDIETLQIFNCCSNFKAIQECLREYFKEEIETGVWE